VTTCLLCSAPAVADGLCVDDGARLWAAQRWEAMPNATAHAVHLLRRGHRPSTGGAEQRIAATLELATPESARDFLDRLAKAQEERKVALCECGCVSHDEQETSCKTG
jgi:hypothetical protein